MRFGGRPRAAAIVCLAACLGAWLWTDRVAGVAAQSLAPETKLTRIDRLEIWIRFVKQHEPGAVDDAVQEVNTWSAGDLQRLWIDLSSVVSLVRDPKVRLFVVPQDRELRWNQQQEWEPAPPRKPIPVLYTVGELKRLQAIGSTFGGPAEGRENVMLRRGAMLHADVAMLASADARPARGFVGAKRYRLNMNDGRPTGLDTEVDHWDLGRRLLARIRVRDARAVQGPGSDDAVRMWYLATFMHLISVGDLDPPHFAYGLDLFPKDPEVLFMNAVLHETMAGARRQAAMRAANVPVGVTFAMRSPGGELAEAERLYRRALDSAPDFAEARLRYGRVLGERGRHQEAVVELQKAVADAQGPLLQYYAALFLGGELEAAEKNDEASHAYERAATLFPSAQSPRLGISRVAIGSKRATAREALLALTAQPPEGDARDDPWWSYDVSGGRAADIVLEKLHDMIRSGGR